MLVTFSIPAQPAPIKLGISNATSGPSNQLGNSLNQGASVYFSRINAQGGVNGQPIEMHLLDDGYEPYFTKQNTNSFVEQDDIFALFNYVGTPTSHAIFTELKKNNILYITPFTGAEFLRKPYQANIINLRASYFQETAAHIDFLVNEKKLTKIGLLVQADQFGSAVEKGYLQAMSAYNVKPVITTRYRRNTEEVDWALELLKKKQVEAIAFVGTYQPFANLINKAYEQNFMPQFVSVSFVSSGDLFQRLQFPSKVLVTEVVPDPNTCQVAICQQFRQDMKNNGYKRWHQVHFEGYLNAHLFAELAKGCQSPLTTSCFQQEVQHFKQNIAGLNVMYSPHSNQGSNQVFKNHFTP